MSLYPAGYPWLSKPQVMLEAGSMIADSTAKARGLIGYLDFANGQDGNGRGRRSGDRRTARPISGASRSRISSGRSTSLPRTTSGGRSSSWRRCAARRQGRSCSSSPTS